MPLRLNVHQCLSLEPLPGFSDNLPVFFYIEQDKEELFTVNPGGAMSLKYGFHHYLGFFRIWQHVMFPVEEVNGGE